MSNSGTDATQQASAAVSDHRTVKQHFDDCMREYEADILGSDLDSTSPQLQERVRRLLRELEMMWHRFEAAGACSINDRVEDLSTATITMLVTPFVVADLQQRITEVAPTGAGAGVGPTTAAHGSLDRHSTRSKSLLLSMHYFHIFLELAVQLGMLSEKDVELGCRHNSDDRTRRIENSRRLSELRREIESLDRQIGLAAARSRRMRQLIMDEDGEAYEERGNDDDELLRRRAVARLEWAVLEAMRQVQLAARELEMLKAMSDDSERRRAVESYRNHLVQAETDGSLGLGRDTYTILPGGQIVTGAPHLQRRIASQSAAAEFARQQVEGGTGVGFGGSMTSALSASRLHNAAAVDPSVFYSASTFREQVRSEVFMERNRPTMTLAEFAQMEMAEVQRQMTAQQDAQLRQAEEDARLGEEGVEERKRQYDSKWSDWKDENPPIGITTKGNYS